MRTWVLKPSGLFRLLPKVGFPSTSPYSSHPSAPRQDYTHIYLPSLEHHHHHNVHLARSPARTASSKKPSQAPHPTTPFLCSMPTPFFHHGSLSPFESGHTIILSPVLGALGALRASTRPRAGWAVITQATLPA